MGDDEGSGKAYRVEYLDGEREGKDGSLTWVARAGRARVQFANGDEFEGEFNEMKLKHGQGVYIYAGDGAGDGEEDEDAAEGKSGSTIKAQYAGDFRFGKKHGTGKMRYPDGGVYTGGWSDGQREGAGSYYYPNGDVFTGRWASGKKEGRGSYLYATNGSMLAGTWKSDVFSAGKWVQSDNTSYHGSFSGQNPTGSGCFYFPSGNVVEGKYEGKVVAEEAEEAEGGASTSGSWVADARSLSRVVGASAADLAKVNNRDPQELKEIEDERKAAELKANPPEPAEAEPAEAEAEPPAAEAEAAPAEAEAAAE